MASSPSGQTLRRDRREEDYAAVSVVLTTRRLELRPLSEEDLDRVYAHWSVPEVSRRLWDDEGPSRERVVEELARSGEMFAERGFGLWGVFLGDGLFLGVCGLLAVPEEAGEFEIVFSTELSEWRCGYAFEAAEAVLLYVFDASLDRVLGRCDLFNEASRRLFEKLGTVFESASIQGVDDYYYRLRR